MPCTSGRFPPSPWKNDAAFLEAFFVVLLTIVSRVKAEIARRDAERLATAPDRVVGSVRPVSVEEAERHLAETRG